MTEYTRRQIFHLSLDGFAAVALALPRLVSAANSGSELDWPAFLQKLEMEARHQFAPTWNQHAYVQQVALLLKRLNFATPPLSALLARARDPRPGGGTFPAFDELEHRVAFQVSLISFEKSQVIPHHNHPNMTGVMICANGALEVESFEPNGVST